MHTRAPAGFDRQLDDLKPFVQRQPTADECVVDPPSLRSRRGQNSLCVFEGSSGVHCQLQVGEGWRGEELGLNLGDDGGQAAQEQDRDFLCRCRVGLVIRHGSGRIRDGFGRLGRILD